MKFKVSIIKVCLCPCTS